MLIMNYEVHGTVARLTQAKYAYTIYHGSLGRR